MEDLPFLGVSVPLVVVAFTRTTRVTSILGLLMLGGAAAMFAMMGDTSGDDHGLQGLANGMLALGAMGLGIVGVILLCVGGNRQSEKGSPQEPTLPVGARRQSGFTWLGVLVIAGAFAMLGTIDGDGGTGPLPDRVPLPAAIGVMTFGVILVAVGISKTKKRCHEALALPVATAIATGDD